MSRQRLMMTVSFHAGRDGMLETVTGEVHHFLRSHKLNRDAAERAEIAMQRVAFAGEHHAGERSCQHQMAGLQRHPWAPSLLASQATPSAGWPSTPAAT